MQKLSEHIYESFQANLIAEDAKDEMRINDIMNKSNGNVNKANQLAQQMANSIKDKGKALRRYLAAKQILGDEHEVTEIFKIKATSLGNQFGDEPVGAQPKESTKKNTFGKLGSDSSLRNMGRESDRRPAPILPLGVTNLQTGKCKYFNIFDTWGRDNDTTIELWADISNGPTNNPKYKLVFTSGSGPIFKIGESKLFIHDQNHRDLFFGKLVDWVNIGDAELLIKKYGVKSASGYVYK